MVRAPVLGMHDTLDSQKILADGGGYVDFGQEDWDDEAYSGDESNPNKRAKGTAKTKGVFNNLMPKPKKKPTERVSNLFLGGGRGDVIGPGGPKVSATPQAHTPAGPCRDLPSARLPLAA